MWSYHPKAPFQALAYICWTLPKEILIWAFRLRGFQVGGEIIEPSKNPLFVVVVVFIPERNTCLTKIIISAGYNDHTPSNISFTPYQSYGAVNEPPDVDDTNNHLGRVDELNIWWRLFGMALYLFGLTIMLVYGSLKG